MTGAPRVTKDFGPEQAVHGKFWEHLHGGYFSDPAVARPLVAAVRGIWTQARPDVVIDLGGGTGFLLSQLQEAGVAPDARLVNLDGSETQLKAACVPGIELIRGSVEDFRRAAVVPAGRRALFLMRSVLHYAGKAGLAAVLHHLRAQAEPSEYWVHQTACFADGRDADCLNALYARMHTRKWYPTVVGLQKRLRTAGWRIEAIHPAPTLRLESRDLGARYSLSAPGLRHIAEEMVAVYGVKSSVWHATARGFQADLHYHIFICRAES